MSSKFREHSFPLSRREEIESQEQEEKKDLEPLPESWDLEINLEKNQAIFRDGEKIALKTSPQELLTKLTQDLLDKKDAEVIKKQPERLNLLTWQIQQEGVPLINKLINKEVSLENLAGLPVADKSVKAERDLRILQETPEKEFAEYLAANEEEARRVITYAQVRIQATALKYLRKADPETINQFLGAVALMPSLFPKLREQTQKENTDVPFYKRGKVRDQLRQTYEEEIALMEQDVENTKTALAEQEVERPSLMDISPAEEKPTSERFRLLADVAEETAQGIGKLTKGVSEIEPEEVQDDIDKLYQLNDLLRETEIIYAKAEEPEEGSEIDARRLYYALKKSFENEASRKSWLVLENPKERIDTIRDRAEQILEEYYQQHYQEHPKEMRAWEAVPEDIKREVEPLSTEDRALATAKAVVQESSLHQGLQVREKSEETIIPNRSEAKVSMLLSNITDELGLPEEKSTEYISWLLTNREIESRKEGPAAASQRAFQEARSMWNKLEDADSKVLEGEVDRFVRAVNDSYEEYHETREKGE